MSRYRPGPSDYDHGFHAGNVGDVLKHCVLVAWAKALAGATHFVDTHAGAGMYKLPPQGEWQAGVGRIDAASEPPALVRDYLQAVGDKRSERGGLYPGSPAILRGLMGPEDRLSLVEMADAPRAKLSQFYADEAAVSVHGGDGLAFTTEGAVFIDPPYVQKDEWDAVAACAQRQTGPVLVWYPIKSLMRPRRLAESVGACVTIDLITRPLGQSKKALNGSGVLLVRPPAGLVESVAATLPWLGATLAAGSWESIVRG